MSDLISRNALIKEIETLKVHVTGLRAGKGVLSEFEQKYRETIVRVVEEQPTAYDVEKVVEKLDDMSGIQFDGKYESYQLDWCIEINKAIEIVRKGGKE